MRKKLPVSRELEETTKLMRRKNFLYITSFADILNRFSEIHFKVPLRFTALSFLITRGGSLTPTELARLMFRSKHSITKIIDGLEKEGFVVRVPDSKDRRSLQVKITSKGLQHAKKNMIRGDEYVKDLISCLDKAEWENLIHAIKKLRKNLMQKMAEG